MPIGGSQGLSNSQVSNVNNYNQSYGFSATEFDSKMDYIESEGN